MMVQIRYFSLLLLFFFTLNVHAGTPVSGIATAYRQDTLILGTIKKAKDGMLNIHVTYVFPQNKVWFLDVGDNINVRTNFVKTVKKAPDDALKKNSAVKLKPTEEYFKKVTSPEPPAEGKKYLLSLNKETRWFSSSFYYPAWGLFEVKGSSYSNMKLVQENIFEHKELQDLINSGGLKKIR